MNKPWIEQTPERKSSARDKHQEIYSTCNNFANEIPGHDSVMNNGATNSCAMLHMLKFFRS
jgi:hypothetical protein